LKTGNSKVEQKESSFVLFKQPFSFDINFKEQKMNFERMVLGKSTVPRFYVSVFLDEITKYRF
jgi:hypothetical protein